MSITVNKTKRKDKKEWVKTEVSTNEHPFTELMCRSFYQLDSTFYKLILRGMLCVDKTLNHLNRNILMLNLFNKNHEKWKLLD